MTDIAAHFCGISLGVFTDEQRERILRDAPINPKLAPLVEALNRAGIRTTMSGDFYGENLVYVDLEDVAAVDTTRLPAPWVLTCKDVTMTRADITGTPSLDQSIHGRSGWGYRLAREGGAISPAEAEQLLAALTIQPENGPDR